MKTVICSHGFGVGADGRGMFPDIAAAFPALKFVMFDYNSFDEVHNATVSSLQKQAEKLNAQIAAATAHYVVMPFAGLHCGVFGRCEQGRKADFLGSPGCLECRAIYANVRES